MRKTHILVSITILLLAWSTSSIAQELTVVKKEHNNYFEEYQILKEDSTVKQGTYLLFYKGKIIEKGQFTSNEKKGKWLYFSLDAIFEYEYDYDIERVTKISGKHKKEDYIQTPVLFQGSPITPYLYLVKNIRYPIEAKKHNLKGRVSLALQLDKEGEIVSFYIKEKLHPLLDRAVIDVAKTFPEDWEWIPANYNGNNIDGEYSIDIEFELVE